MFGVIKLTKNVDPNKYSYFGYGIGFDSRSLFSYADFDWVENIVCEFFFSFFFFFFDFRIFEINDDIINIHKYFMKKCDNFWVY